MKIIKAPCDTTEHDSFVSVFLAGSIEMGVAEDWQHRVECELKDYSDEMLTILNPRRDDFDASQEQSINNPYFNEQVNWELNGLSDARIIFMYFHPDTKAPITLLELGLCVENSDIVLVCPEKFYRKGNVEIVAKNNNVPLFLTLEDGIKELRKRIDYEKDFMMTSR